MVGVHHGVVGEGHESGQVAPAAGTLLIASPRLSGPEFARALVLLLEVDDDGVLGVVLNRPSQVSLTGLDAWGQLASDPAVVYSGGPVEPEGALAVATLAPGAVEPDGWHRMFGDTGLVDLNAASTGQFDSLRVYAGYAGWSPGQLDSEIAEGAWYVVPAWPEDLAAADPDLLWRTVLRRQPAPLSMLLTMPANPAAN